MLELRVGIRGGVDHAAEAALVGLDAGDEDTLYAHREVALQGQLFEQCGIVEPVEVVELVDQELLGAALVVAVDERIGRTRVAGLALVHDHTAFDIVDVVDVGQVLVEQVFVHRLAGREVVVVLAVPLVQVLHDVF